MSQNDWIHPIKRVAEPRLRLFCLPYAGAGTAPFRRWVTSLPPDVEVCAVCLPGREHRMGERAFDRMEPLVESLLQALLPFLNRPFVLYGHSLGALLSFEVSRALVRLKGIEPERLILSARNPPDVREPVPIHQLPEDRFITELRVRYNAIPPMILNEPELMGLFIPLLRADLAVLETFTYKPQELLRCPITVIGGTEDRMVTEAAMQRWSEFTRGPFRQYMLKGDHFFIQSNQAAFLKLLATELQAS